MLRIQWLSIYHSEWNRSKFRFAGIWGDYGYFVPEATDFKEHLAYYPLRAVGEGIVISATCPGHTVKDASFEKLCQMAEFIDCDEHRTCAPIALLEAYWLAKRSLKSR